MVFEVLQEFESGPVLWDFEVRALAYDVQHG
jgi:hypothetical protein